MSCYQTACTIVKKLQDHGFIAYFAGGWVRDHLMNHPSDDIDIATSASVQDMQKIFTKTIPVGIQFGILIVVENGHQFEMATFRKDEGYEDGRRPIGISHANAKEDASRRDFTINGMFFEPNSKELVDYVNGQDDLKNKIVRAIGNPHERFLEDRLRMIRAVRYATRFGFTIDPHTEEAIIIHSNALFPSVAIERICQEFLKIDRFNKLKLFLLKLHQLELLQTIFPDLNSISYEILKSRLAIIDSFPSDIPLIGKLLEMFPEYTLEMKIKLCEYLKLPLKDREFVHYADKMQTTLSKNQPETFEWAHLYASPWAESSIKMFAAKLSLAKKETFSLEHEKRMHQLRPVVIRIKTHDPLVKSSHLKDAGISPGKTMGNLLKEAERLSINLNLDSPEAVIQLLKRSSLWPQ